MYTRTSLALLGVLSVVFGLIAGYGLTMAIGLPFTSLEQTLPYILEGIGLDVIFILVKGAAHRSCLENERQRRSCRALRTSACIVLCRAADDTMRNAL